MRYCKDHNEKAYSEKGFGKVRVCEHASSYRCIKDKKIRVYCFRPVDEGVCPHDRREMNRLVFGIVDDINRQTTGKKNKIKVIKGRR